MSNDPRIPVYLDAQAAMASDVLVAWLVEGDCEAPGALSERFAVSTAHVPGCACCLPRGAAAQALGRLFVRRARGEVAMFDAVAVRAGAAGVAAVEAALTGDVLALARFRLG